LYKLNKEFIMRTSRFLFAMGVSLAMALTFSCTEETNEDGESSSSVGVDGDSSSSSGGSRYSSSSGPDGRYSSSSIIGETRNDLLGSCAIPERYNKTCYEYAADYDATLSDLVEMCEEDEGTWKASTACPSNCSDPEEWAEGLMKYSCPKDPPEPLSVVGSCMIEADGYYRPYGECYEFLTGYDWTASEGKEYCEEDDGVWRANSPCPTTDLKEWELIEWYDEGDRRLFYYSLIRNGDDCEIEAAMELAMCYANCTIGSPNDYDMSSCMVGCNESLEDYCD
jgi:hypothetical protein